MKFCSVLGATLATASTAFALAIPASNGDVNVARGLGALSGGAWAEQLDARADLQERIVWNPTITQPDQGETFISGVPMVVKWDTSKAPEGANLDAPVLIKLGYDDGDNLHEYWDLVTAEQNIPLSKGHTIVTLPDGLETRQDYIVVVFGDSGNASGKFKIVPNKSSKRTLVERIVYNPKITAPSKGESFAAGSDATVTWSLDNLPDTLKESKVEIKLGYAPSENDPGYHEKWSLGEFSITDGKAKVTLPGDLEPRSDYLFVVLGDSGNFSPQFSVTKA